MRFFAGFALVGFLSLAWSLAAAAKVQPQMYCWDPDHEFPVSCSDEEEGEDVRPDPATPPLVGWRHAPAPLP
jgi:hypothetical protein